MKKVFKVQNIDCANCAAEIENAVNKLEDVKNASLSFMTGRLVVESDCSDFDALVEKIKDVCMRVEPDCIFR